MAQTVDFSSLINADCPLTWSVSSNVAGSLPAITQIGPTNPSLTIFYDTDLDPASDNDSVANPYISVYTITVTGTNTDPFELMCDF